MCHQGVPERPLSVSRVEWLLWWNAGVDLKRGKGEAEERWMYVYGG